MAQASAAGSVETLGRLRGRGELESRKREATMYRVEQQVQTDDDALAKRLVSHWLGVFGSMSVVNEPFQHFYTDRVWPTDVYDQLLTLLPPKEHYQPLNIKKWANTKGVSTRDMCYLPEIIGHMEPERATFWHQVWLALTADSLKRLMFRKFNKDIALRLRMRSEEVESADVVVHISLARDIEGYRIKPHPDGWPAIVTAQFYLPLDISQQDLGTSLYAKRRLLRRLVSGRYAEIRHMRFAPNCGYAFAVNDLPRRRSLHGRERIRAGAGLRNSMLIRWSAPSSSRKRGHGGISNTHQLF
jgi:hypothetical protein